MIDVDKAVRGLTDAERKMRFKAEIYGRAAAAKLQRRAAVDAPWTDRTGHARQSIRPEIQWVDNDLEIGVSGNMNYSVYLEFANDKRFAVLYPTLDRMQAEILRGFTRLL